MENIEKIIGARVRQARKLVKMSQKDLAINAKCSLTTINRLEKGRQFPHSDTIKEIARVLKLSYSDLLIDKNEQNNSALLQKLESIETFTKEMVDDKIKNAVNEHSAMIFDDSARGKLMKIIYELDESEAKSMIQRFKDQLDSIRSLKAVKLEKIKKKETK